MDRLLLFGSRPLSRGKRTSYRRQKFNRHSFVQKPIFIHEFLNKADSSSKGNLSWDMAGNLQPEAISVSDNPKQGTRKVTLIWVKTRTKASNRRCRTMKASRKVRKIYPNKTGSSKLKLPTSVVNLKKVYLETIWLFVDVGQSKLWNWKRKVSNKTILCWQEDKSFFAAMDGCRSARVRERRDRQSFLAGSYRADSDQMGSTNIVCVEEGQFSTLLCWLPKSIAAKKQNLYPLSRIYECIDSLRKVAVFSTTNANYRYRQVEIENKDWAKTTSTS